MVNFLGAPLSNITGTEGSPAAPPVPAAPPPQINFLGAPLSNIQPQYGSPTPPPVPQYVDRQAYLRQQLVQRFQPLYRAIGALQSVGMDPYLPIRQAQQDALMGISRTPGELNEAEQALLAASRAQGIPSIERLYPQPPRYEPLREAINLARTEIPGAERVAELAGQLGERVGETTGRLALGPFGVVPGTDIVPETMGKVVEFLAETAVPTEAWMLGLEAFPGTGITWDIVRAAKRGAPDAVAAVGKALDSPVGQQAMRVLRGERELLPQERELLAGIERNEGVGVRQGVEAFWKKGLGTVEAHRAGDTASIRLSGLDDQQLRYLLDPQTQRLNNFRTVYREKFGPGGPYVTVEVSGTEDDIVDGFEFIAQQLSPSPAQQAMRALREGESGALKLPGSGAVPESRLPAEVPPSAVPEEGIPEDPLRRVEGEWIHPPEMGIAKRGRTRLLPFAQSMDEAASQLSPTVGTGIARGVAKIPGGKAVVGVINRAALAGSDPVTALTALYRRILNQGQQGAEYAIDAYLRDKPIPFEIDPALGVVRNLPEGSRFGPKATTTLVPPGTQAGGFEGENVLDVLERATRADVGKHITQEQWTWITTARALIDDAIEDLLKARGISWGSEGADKYLRKLGFFKQGEHYFPRNVMGRAGIEGGGNVFRVGIGGRAFYEKSRLHQYVAQGLSNGLNYADPRVSLENFLQAMRHQTADEYLLQIAKGLGKTRKEMLEQFGIDPRSYPGALPGYVFGKEGVIAARESAVPGLRGRIFPADIISEIDKNLLDTGSELARKLNQATSIPRLLKVGFDAGASFIQGLPALTRNPVVWGRATARAYKAISDPAIRSRYLQRERSIIQEYLDLGGQLQTPEIFDAVRAPGLLETGRLRNAATLGIRTAARRAATVFDTFLDVGRIEMWKALRTKADDAEKPFMMGVVRDMFGTTSPEVAGLAKTQTEIENAVLWFSSRYTKSPVALAAHVLGKRASAQEALRIYAQFLGGSGLAMYGFAKMAGMDDDEIATMFDPGSGKRFMSIRVGENYIGIGGAYRALAQLAAQSYVAVKDDPMAFQSTDLQRNPMLRWFRSRTAPITSTALTLGAESDFIGRPVEDWQDRLRVVLENFTPLTIDAAFEAQGSPWDKLISGSASFIGLRQVPLSSGDKLDIARDREAEKMGFSNFDEMRKALGTSAAVAELNKNPQIKGLYDTAREENQLRRQERGEISLSDALEPFREEQIQADADPELQDPQAWIGDHKARRYRQAGALALWERDNPEQVKRMGEYTGDPFNLPADIVPDDLKAAYFKVFRSHKTLTGGIDDQDKLAEDLDRFEGQLTPAQLDRLRANIGLNATEREKAYVKAVRTLADSGYFDRRDKAFEKWRKLVRENSPSPELREAADSWAEPRDLREWLESELSTGGRPPEYYTAHPVWTSWEKSYSGDNFQFLHENPPADLIAVLWGYQSRVHSPEAGEAYRQETGKAPPYPIQR